MIDRLVIKFFLALAIFGLGINLVGAAFLLYGLVRVIAGTANF